MRARVREQEDTLKKEKQGCKEMQSRLETMFRAREIEWAKANDKCGIRARMGEGGGAKETTEGREKNAAEN